MRYAIIKKASIDEQKNQTTTTNINYIQNFMNIYKKSSNKVNIASDKSETEQNNLFFTRKNMHPVHNKAVLQLGKKERNSKVNKFACFKKTINFKVRKFIRHQLKLSIGFIITNTYMGGHYELSSINPS